MKKDLLKRVFLSAAFLVSAISFFSCTIGMGESVDLEAPVLTITSPKNGAFMPKSFIITGTATDNRKVERVEIVYKYKANGNYVQNTKTADLSGTTWLCDFTFDGDYEVEFEAFAYDAMENGSDDSHQRVMVLIDSQDPDETGMKITRNGKYISKLIQLEQFTNPENGKTAQRNKSENKDYFQNESFVLSTNLKDNYGIEDVYMAMYEVDAASNAETLIIEKIEPDSKDNMYAPSFTITEKMLVDGKPSLASGLHYLKPYVYAKDAAGNALPRTEYGVLAWEPEYNVPHVSFNAMKNEIIEVTQGASIIVSIFDDDDLKNYSYTLVKKDIFETAGNTIDDFRPTNITELESGLRDTAIEITTDTTAKDFAGEYINLGRYYLVVRVEDVSGRDDGVYFKSTLVKIKNEDAPTVFVDSPEENSVPNLSNNKFTIKGRVSDNEEDVKIAIAWLGPDASPTDISNAEDFFEYTYKFTDNGTIGTIGTNGKIWMIPQMDKSTAETDESGKYYEKNNNYNYNWEKEFNFFEDFKIGSKTDNTNKVFMIAALDPTGNVTTQTFRMGKFTDIPTIEVKYNQGSDVTTTSPVITLTPGQEVKLTIKPNTANHIPLKTCYIKAADVATKNALSWSDTGKVLATGSDEISFIITSTQAASGRTLNFNLYAEDELGLKATPNLTVLFEIVGTLESIDCNSNTKYIFTAGEKIKLQANFNGKVSVSSGTPYIQISGTNLKYKNDDPVQPEDLRAYYTKGSDTNTLYFEYTVPRDKEIEGTDLTISSIIANGATISGVIDNTVENNVDEKKYAIDTIAPYITSMTPANNGVVEKKDDGSVDIVFNFNESVSVESGTIVMQRTANWYIPPVLSEDVFTKIWTSETVPANREALCGSSTSTFVLPKNNENKETSLIAVGPYMQYTNGLTSGTGYDADGNKNVTDCMIPDVSTKYVLAYNYNINDTTANSPVSKIRAVLEKHNYHKTEFEATVVKVEDIKEVKNGVEVTTGKVTLNVKNSDWVGGFVNGVEYFLTLTAGAFYDKAYNYSTAIKTNEFWVGPVATPVIRVNRTATNGNTDNPTGNNGSAKTNFKIDCETPGATIKYGISNKTETGKTTNEDNLSVHTYIADITKTNFDGISLETEIKTLNGSTEVSSKIGDGLLTTAQKIYIRAQASKEEFTKKSSIGKEGAFKTALHYVYNKDNNNKAVLERIYGAQSPEGASFTAGFPLTQNGENISDYQIPYQNNRDFYWISWQILSDFTLQTKIRNKLTNFQDPADPSASYGQYIYCKNKNHYTAQENE